MDPTLIDCAGCPGKGLRCGDCVVTTFLALPRTLAADERPLDQVERSVVGLMVSARLVRPDVAEAAVARIEHGRRHEAAG